MNGECDEWWWLMMDETQWRVNGEWWMTREYTKGQFVQNHHHFSYKSTKILWWVIKVMKDSENTTISTFTTHTSLLNNKHYLFSLIKYWVWCSILRVLSEGNIAPSSLYIASITITSPLTMWWERRPLCPNSFLLRDCFAGMVIYPFYLARICLHPSQTWICGERMN